MADLFLLSEAQMRRIEPYFPLSHGVPRVDDRRVISGIVFVIRNGLRWRDAPREYGPHKTIYNRFVRWSRLGVFNKIFAELAGNAGKPQRLMIDTTHLNVASPMPEEAPVTNAVLSIDLLQKSREHRSVDHGPWSRLKPGFPR